MDWFLGVKIDSEKYTSVIVGTASVFICQIHNDIIPFYYLAYEIKIGISENNTYLSDNFHTLGHRSKYVRSEIGVGSKECFDFSIDIGTQWQIFDLVFSRNQNCWFNIASISKLPTRIGLSNNAWLKKKYFLIKNVFVFVINKTCILGMFRNNRPVFLLSYIFLGPFNITSWSLNNVWGHYLN